MSERVSDQERFKFKTVRLLKEQSLGIGSYGAVCKAECDDLLCAAKIIHPTLFDPTALHQITPQREHRLPIRRFEQECEFMNAIRHPNIVQYLGMFRDTETCLPVLLMELMDDSLTHFLESSPQVIPYHIQVNICHDITLALSFLHTNNIVHRDLSSNNVLMIGNARAKVTDFGMARLGDINPQATHFTNTMCPGTDVYMPPEAVQDKPVYTEKIDCFSFGVIAVQILTQKVPKPGDRLQKVEFSHPGLPTGEVLIRIPETTRRQNHLGEIDRDHPFRPHILDCLKDNDNERPSAHQLCDRLAGLKRMSKYADSARTAQDKDEVIQLQAFQLEEKERQFQQENCRANRLEERERQLQLEKDQALERKVRQLEEKDQQLQQASDRANRLEERERQLQLEKDQALEEKERQLGRINQQLEAAEHAAAQFERRVTELEQQLSQREKQNSAASGRGTELTSIKLRLREGKRAPSPLQRSCDDVVDSNMVYISNGGTLQMYCYHVTTDSWSQLPDSSYSDCSITVINGWLTTVGGDMTNKLFSLIEKGNERKWTEKFPSMLTKRSSTTALCAGSALIVAGGMGEHQVLSTVELMDTESHQWSTAADLPHPMYGASATVCRDSIYMLGGCGEHLTFVKSVYTVSVSALLQSRPTSSLLAKLKGMYLTDTAIKWRQVADLPVRCATCESFHGRLLAVGGVDYARKPTVAVHMYNSTTNSWEINSHMTTGRYDCFTAVLPNNQLMVVGGKTGDRHAATDTIEFVNV